MAGASGVEAVSSAIDTSHATDPAAVYQTQRWVYQLTYTIPNLTPNANYNVRIHFVESYFHATQRRLFSIRLNRAQVLSNFDLFESAGGANIAVVQQFPSSADATGKITAELDASVNNASIAGIEVVAASASPTPSPSSTSSPMPTTFYRPSASAAPKLAYNPNPMTTKTCTLDPCSPAIDSSSSTYISHWFGPTVTFPGEAITIPGNPSSDGYDQISIFNASGSSYNLQCGSGIGGSCHPTSTVVAVLPNGARSDANNGLLNVVNVAAGTEVGVDCFNTGSSGSSTCGSGNAVSNGLPNPVWNGYVSSFSATCFATLTCHGGGANIPQDSNELDPVELLQQNIPHMLHLIGRCVTSSYVYPATDSDASGPSGCVPEGEILWLDKSDAAIEAMTQPRWVKTLYHNLHDYGWVLADQTDPNEAYPNNTSIIQAVSDLSWTAIGQPSQWALMLAEIKAEGSTINTINDSPPYDRITIPTDPSITVSNLHWLQYKQNH
jgi:hypothetical protein